MTKYVKIPNESNQKLAAIIDTPISIKNVNPIVIIIHGLKGYKEERHHEELAQRLAENNIIAVRFDLRGYGESEGTLGKDYRFTNFIKDVAAVYKYTKQLPSIDSNRIGICGVSMGGMLAIIAMQNFSEIRSGVIISAPDNPLQNSDLNQFLPSWEKTGYLELPGSLRGKVQIPFAFAEDIRQYDMKGYIQNVRCPLLFITGSKDTNVPPQSTKAIYTLANGPKTFLEIPEADHFYKKDLDITYRINSSVVSFFINTLSP